MASCLERGIGDGNTENQGTLQHWPIEEHILHAANKQSLRVFRLGLARGSSLRKTEPVRWSEGVWGKPPPHRTLAERLVEPRRLPRRYAHHLYRLCESI